jgi:hypothetical protein
MELLRPPTTKRLLVMTDCSGLSEKIDIRGDKQSDADNSKSPEQGLFLFRHTQIDEKKTDSIKGMEDKEKEENEIEGLVLVER